ncbi:hypothetical protein TorRG33x02_285290 [Trema orientale]|uniref:Uncharacterized protein n=1 Tax=Trema orientale TaxID=63057 RepID=A0A2P5CGU5_TREOI|nr:hypothetical protein TorRG33x02_285290 [Trema orientale]
MTEAAAGVHNEATRKQVVIVVLKVAPSSAIDAARSLKKFFVNFLSPEKIKEKIICKGGESIKSIEIKVPEKPNRREPEEPKEKPKEPEKPKSQICHQSQNRISPTGGHKSDQNHHTLHPLHPLNPVHPTNWLRLPLPVWLGTFGLPTLLSRVVRNATEAMVVEHGVTFMVASL